MKLLSLFLFPLWCVWGGDIIRGMNYYGLETPNKDFVCGWAHRPAYYLEILNRLGFNSIRLPFSLEYIRAGDFSKMDEFFGAIQSYPNMTVLLDMHRVFSSHQGPQPEEDWVTMDIFLNGWDTILTKYQHNKQIFAVDVFNEYQGTDTNYWNQKLHIIVEHIENNFPGRFHYHVGGIRWGGDLHYINLEDLPYAKRIHYTLHKYIFSSFGNRIDDWDWAFGIYRNVPGKVLVGEWGFMMEKYDQVQWATEFISYLRNHNITNTYFWTTSLSSDTNGLWKDNCQDIDWDKYKIIKTLWEPISKKNHLRISNNSSTQSYFDW
jgi:endoglucanase